MDEPEPAEERWSCAGVRVLDGKRAIAWLTPHDDRLRYFTDKGHWVTGGVYRVRCTWQDDRVVRHGDPLYVGPRGDAGLRQRWAAEEVAAKARLESYSLARSAAKVSALDDALAPLVAIAKGMRTQQQRDAFCAHIISKVSRTWYGA
jgi:hypothetical protein